MQFDENSPGVPTWASIYYFEKRMCVKYEGLAEKTPTQSRPGSA